MQHKLGCEREAVNEQAYNEGEAAKWPPVRHADVHWPLDQESSIYQR